MHVFFISDWPSWDSRATSTAACVVSGLLELVSETQRDVINDCLQWTFEAYSKFKMKFLNNVKSSSQNSNSLNVLKNTDEEIWIIWNGYAALCLLRAEDAAMCS